MTVMRLPIKVKLPSCIKYAMEMGPAPDDALNWVVILSKWWKDQGAEPKTLPLYLRLWYSDSDTGEDLSDKDLDNFVEVGCDSDKALSCEEFAEYPSFSQGCSKIDCPFYNPPDNKFRLAMPKVSYEEVLGQPKLQQINVAVLAEQLVRGMNIKRLPGGVLAVYNQGIYVTEDSEFLIDAVVRNYLKNELNTRLHSNLFLHIKAMADPVAWDDFEIYPHLLCCPNGVVDLKTKELLDHSPLYMMLHKTRALYRPTALKPMWERLVKEIVEEVKLSEKIVEDQQEYYKTLWGCSITGETRDEIFIVHQGAGGSGKTTITSGIQHALGTYIQQVDPDILLTKGDNYKPSYELANGVGKRIFLTNESKEGAKVNTQLIKSIATEGATFNARQIRERPFTYTIRAKSHLVMNPPMILDEQDKAIERRLHYIRYQGDFTANPDKTLKKQLQSESEGILAWMVEGAFNYYQKGLILTKAVSMAVKDLFEDSDPLFGFIDATLDNFNITEGVKVSSDQLFKDYKTYCGSLCINTEKFDPRSFGRTFNAQLKLKGWKYTPIRSNGKTVYKGIGYQSVNEGGY